MRRVMARVSTSQIPGRLWLFNQSSSGFTERQFAGSVMSPRRTTPRAAGVIVSISSTFVPTLPMCGKVKVMIWPA